VPNNRFIATEEERKKAIEWFSSRGLKPICSQCNRDLFTMGRPVATLVLMADGVLDPEIGLFLLPLVCGHCAHIEWFFPYEMGTLPEAVEPL